MSSNSENPSIRGLYKRFGINRKYDHPANLSDEDSHFGNGNYPPDWSDRREAVLEHQNGRCARCRTPLKDEDYYNCHHYRPVAEGGQHSLSNLVNLCVNCHKLIHPQVEKLDGDWTEAPIFPHPDADRRMATVRTPVTPEEEQQYQPELALIAKQSPAGENEFANSEATIPVSPGDALRMRNEFEQLLDDMGLDEKTSLTLRIVNLEHSPLRDASVEVEIPDSNTKLTGTSDELGEVRFELPSDIRVEIRATKPNFVDNSFTLDITGESQYHETQLELTGENARVATGEFAKNQTDRSRRSIMYSLGLVGAGAVGGYLLSDRGDDRPVNSASAITDSDPGTGDEAGTEAPTEVPVRGFTDRWSNAIDTYEPITIIAEDDTAIYPATSSGLVRSLTPTGDVNWSQSIQGDLVSIEVADDGVIAVTPNQITSLTKESGEKQWTAELDNTDSESVVESALGQDTVVVTCDGDRSFMKAFSTSSGQQLWELNEPSPYDINPTFVSGSLYYGSDNLSLIQAPGESGDKSPEDVSGAENFNGGIAKGDSLYYYASYESYEYSGGGFAKIYAIEPERNEVVWVRDVNLETDSGYVVLFVDPGLSVLTDKGIWFGDYSAEELSVNTDWGINDRVTPTQIDDTLFFMSDNTLVGCRRPDGAVTHETTIDGDVAVLSNIGESVIVGTHAGETRMLTPE